MNAICRSVLSIVLLGLAAGCSGETENDAARCRKRRRRRIHRLQTPREPQAKPPASSAAKPAETRKGESRRLSKGPRPTTPRPIATTRNSPPTELAAIKELPAVGTGRGDRSKSSAR